MLPVSQTVQLLPSPVQIPDIVIREGAPDG